MTDIEVPEGGSWDYSWTRPYQVRLFNPVNDAWLKWLTTEEAIELVWLMATPTSAKDRYRKRRKVGLMRYRASRRRQRKNPDFLIYQAAMPSYENKCGNSTDFGRQS